jgi:hypothetical protein
MGSFKLCSLILGRVIMFANVFIYGLLRGLSN